MSNKDDELDWDRVRHGRMSEYATEDDLVTTYPYEATPRALADFGGASEPLPATFAEEGES